MKKMIPFLIPALALFFQACESVVDDVDLSGIQPKLVVFSYLSPQTDTLVVRVSLSRTLNEPAQYYEPKWIEDASVTFHGPAQTPVALVFDPVHYHYYASLEGIDIIAGREYGLRVSTPGGYSAEASCRIPLPNNTIRLTKLDSVIEEEYKEYRLRIEFDDPSGEPDYYRILAFATVVQSFPGEPEYESEQPVSFRDGENLIDATESDGKTFVLEGEVYAGWYDPSFTQRLKGIRLMLLSTDETYYLFHRSLENYQGDDPFWEPVIIYSNIPDGLGVFAAFNIFETGCEQAAGKPWISLLPGGKTE
ncbi:MAG: DUF4249 domain-containing protein [Bacteroidales bacterium]|nr:DUF4249 domain-containing protein [Bacteroidales bacterium]